LGSDKYAYFDLINLTTTSTTLITPSIESVGNGWCKVVISFTATITGTDAIYFGSSPNMTSGYLPFVGDASKGVYIWGAQLNIGATAKPYFPTTDRLNVPRLTYQNGGGGCPSLLLEKQSTNLVYPSEDFTNANWTTYLGSSVTANTTISPDGTQNADTLNFGTNIQSQLFSTQGASPSASYTASIYAKSSTGKKFRIKFATVTGDYFTSNLTTTSDWQRFTFTYTEEIYHLAFCNESSGGTGTIQIWGAQLE
jgi:hypothetical protein